MSKYASALVNIKALGVKTFSYLIPDEMRDKIQIGQALLVPFGRQGLINAFCVGFSDYLPGDFKVKKINKILFCHIRKDFVYCRNPFDFFMEQIFEQSFIIAEKNRAML